MHCNNGNWFGNFLFYLPYRGAPNGNESHRCIMSNNTCALYSTQVIFIIKGGDDFEH
jgi:hypothetical protein